MKRPTKLIIVLGLLCHALAADDYRFSDLSLKVLQSYPYQPSPLVINALVSETDYYYAYNFSYTSMGRRVSGRLSLPKVSNLKGIILMLRGHQNAAGYYTGKGTEYPARYYLRSGYAVIAPDFFGYGASAPTPSPVEAHQFYSTINAVELYLSLVSPSMSFASTAPARGRLPGSFKKIVLWGHSNGGQVAVHTLEVLKKPVATVLWAPVTLPFPDSMVFYQKGRAPWAEDFKAEYGTADYSLYDYLHTVAPKTPILLEQGSRDYAVPQGWSDAFAAAVKAENAARPASDQINLRYELYPGANHNLEPYWDTVLARDVAFWDFFTSPPGAAPQG
jgi:dienelactone hydrolase